MDNGRTRKLLTSARSKVGVCDRHKCAVPSRMEEKKKEKEEPAEDTIVSSAPSNPSTTTTEFGAPTSSSFSSSPSPAYEYSDMIEIRVRPCAQAPALKKNKLILDRSKTIGQLEKALKKMLKYQDSLFLYVGSGFAPTPDQTLNDLFDNFSVRNVLDIHYGFQEQWG